jgi:signal peptidase I
MKRKGPGIVEGILIILILFLILKTFILQTFRIESDSMLPTLQSGDHVIGLGRFLSLGSDTIRGGLRPLQERFHRGDIVVFKPPVPGNEEYVKRVIAFEGESVAIKADKVLINGRPLEETYARVNQGEPHMDSMAEVTVEPGHLFVLGDNRNHSSDSRSWGTVSVSNVESRLFALLLPVQRLRVLFP